MSAAAICGKALVGPADPVWRDDDVVELEDRVARIGRLLLEDIQAGALNPSLLQRFRQGRLAVGSAVSDGDCIRRNLT